MFRVVENFKGMLPPIDSRSPRDVESDIDDEIAFHLDMKTRELVSAGVEPAAARGFAHQSFGDIQSIKTKCKRLALKERIMLQRVNFVMMILVMALVLGLSYQIWTTQQKTADALGVITTEIAHFRGADERAMSASLPNGQIYVDGNILRPGTYNMPQYGNLSLKRLIASAGGLKQGASARVTVSQLDRDGKSHVKFTTDQLLDDPQTDYILAPNDHVLVRQLPQAADALSALRSGDWRQINETGTVNDQGIKIILISGDDPRNVSGISNAVAQLSSTEGEIGLTFRPDESDNLVVRELAADGQQKITRCRWWFDGNDMMLDLRAARPWMTAPAHVRWIDNADDKIRAVAEAFGVLPNMPPRTGAGAAQAEALAAEQNAKAETLVRFLQHVLNSSGPQPEANVRELLDNAAKQIEMDFANDPQTQARLRDLVEKSRAAIKEREQAE